MPLPQPTDIEDHRELPVSIQDVKDHALIEHDEQDRRILIKIMAATDEAERIIGTAIMLRSFDLVLSAFPTVSTTGIELINPPVRSITSITYFDADGNSQTLDSANYYLLTNGAFPTAMLVPNASWPTAQTRENAVTVRYVAGYASKPSAVPGAIVDAISKRASTLLESTEESGIGGSAWEVPEDQKFKNRLTYFRNMSV